MSNYGVINFTVDEINSILTNCLLKTDQTFTETERDQVMSNLGWLVANKLTDYYTKEEVNTKVAEIDLSNYYTKEEIDSKLTNYYTQEEVNNKVGKIDLTNYYTKEEIDEKLKSSTATE